MSNGERRPMKSQLAECPVHSSVIIQSNKVLTTVGRFSFDEVLSALNLQAMRGSIVWSFVRETLEHNRASKLYPAAEFAFKKRNSREEGVNPVKSLTVGSGKKGVGFYEVTAKNEHLVKRQIEQDMAKLKGSSVKLGKAIEIATKNHTMLPKKEDDE